MAPTHKIYQRRQLSTHHTSNRVTSLTETLYWPPAAPILSNTALFVYEQILGDTSTATLIPVDTESGSFTLMVDMIGLAAAAVAPGLVLVAVAAGP